MVEVIDERGGLESSTLGVFRSAATVKGGRRFSFGALVAVGDKQGNVGIGYAKSIEVPPAIEKAQKDGRKNMKRVTLKGGTIPHEVTGSYSASSVRLVPASPGTGIIAGGTVRAILELAGITDCLTRAYGSTNKKNLAKATLEGLSQLRSRETVAELRGVTLDASEVELKIERGRTSMPARKKTDSRKGPVNTVGQERKGGRGRGGPGGGGGGRGRGGRPGGAGGPSSEGPAPDAPAPSAG